MIKRLAIFLYGVVSYASFFLTLLYAMGNLVVPATMDGQPALPFWEALTVNFRVAVALCGAAQRRGAPGLQAPLDADRAARGGAKHLRVALERLPDRAVRALATARRRCLERAEPGRPCGAVCAVRGLGARALFDVHDQSFSTRSVSGRWGCTTSVATLIPSFRRSTVSNVAAAQASRKRRGQMPDLPGDRMPFGSTASFRVSWKRRIA